MAKSDATKERGLKALALAKKHAVQIDPRLPAGHTAYLESSLAQLGAAVPEQKATLLEWSGMAKPAPAPEQ
jgi:hypothetical protein